MIHILKTIEPHYRELNNGKGCEIRKDDRNFKVGDILILTQYNEDSKKFSGQWEARKVKHICRYNQKEGYVVLTIKEVVLNEVYESFTKLTINAQLTNQKGFTI